MGSGGEGRKGIERITSLNFARRDCWVPVLVQAVGVAQAEEERSLWLAEVTGRWFWPAASPDRLAEAFLAILDAVKTRYILRFEPDRARRGGTPRVRGEASFLGGMIPPGAASTPARTARGTPSPRARSSIAGPPSTTRPPEVFIERTERREINPDQPRTEPVVYRSAAGCRRLGCRSATCRP